MLGDLYYGALRGVGITSLARHLRHGALVLCYHNVVPGNAKSLTLGDRGLHLPLDRFTAQMSWLKDHYSVVPLTELVARLDSGRSVRGCAALTFDDGYAGTFTMAVPLLRRLGLPATMYIVAQAPEQQRLFWWDESVIAPDRATHFAADWALLRNEAHSGIDLGAHTLTHPALTDLGDEDLRRELEDSRDIIEDRTGIRPESFSYPYGIWDARVRDAVHRAGYRSAVTLEFGLNMPGIDPCALRRVNVPAAISVAAFAGWAAGVRPRRAPAA